MAIRLTVERKARVGQQEELSNLLHQLRSKAVLQSGFISGETVVDLWSPRIFMTISRWASVEAWQRWETNRERLSIIERINTLLEGKPVVRLWADGDDRPPAAI